MAFISLISFMTLFFSATAFLLPSCPDGWTKYHESCYLFANVKAEWATALTICKALRSHLVEIDSQHENNFLEGHLQGLGTKDSYWTAGNDIELENEWVWQISRSRIVYTDWDVSQPNNYHLHEDCVKLDTDKGYKWNDSVCNQHNMFICEINLSGGQANLVG